MAKPEPKVPTLQTLLNIHSYFLRLSPPLSETAKEIIAQIETKVLTKITPSNPSNPKAP